jgi:hypothetical protein
MSGEAAGVMQPAGRFCAAIMWPVVNFPTTPPRYLK